MNKFHGLTPEEVAIIESETGGNNIFEIEQGIK